MTSPVITLSPVSGADSLEYVRRIYHESFPPEERRPWEDIVAGSSTGTPRLRGICADGRLIGLVTTWTLPEAEYVEHLCIDATQRGNGAGACVVKALVDACAPLPLLLEVEPEDCSPEAARRIGFYRRCGLDVIDRTYIQPPYAPSLPSVPLWLMASASLDTEAAAHRLHSVIYGVSQPR